jgi:4-amino-4-deoxy-L-arabinose transferase-like glycosyltransferase
VLALATILSRVAVILWLRTDLGDAGVYEHDEIARSLVAGNGFRFTFFGANAEPSGHQAPAIPLVLAAGYALFGVGTAAAKLFAQVVLAILAGAGAYALGTIANRWWGPRAMVIAMLGFLLYPAFAYMPTRVQAVNWALPFLLMFVAGFVTLSEGKGTSRRALLTGLAGGLGALGEPILAAPFGLAWLWLVAERHVRPRHMVLAAAACALAIAPWVVRNALTLGKAGFVKSSFWYVAWQGNHPGATGTDKLDVSPSVARALAWRVAGGRETEALLDSARAQAVSVDIAISAADSAALRALPSEQARMQWFGERLRRELAADPWSYPRVAARRAWMLLWFDPTNPRSYVAAYRVPYLVLALLAMVGFVLMSRARAWPPHG